jgi:hypothetical protein
VSAGLFGWEYDDNDGSDETGCVIGSWLDWWTERVSFSEETALGRTGVPMVNAVGTIDDNERGLKASSGSKSLTAAS